MNLAVFKTIAQGMFSIHSIIKTPSGDVAVQRTPSAGLRKVSFNDGEKNYLAIEQNPATSSEWAARASRGEKIVQFKDSNDHYVAVAVNGDVQTYPIKK